MFKPSFTFRHCRDSFVYLGFVLFISISGISLAQGAQHNVIDTGMFHGAMRSQMENPAHLRPEEFYYRGNFFWEDTIGYFNPPGTNYLFKLNKHDTSLQPVRLDHSIYHGHNFGNELFMHNDTLYSFGGKGLFDVFFGMTFFDFNAGEWFLKPIRGLPENRECVFLWGWKEPEAFYFVYRGFGKNETSNFFLGRIWFSNFQFEYVSPAVFPKRVINLSTGVNYALLLTIDDELLFFDIHERCSFSSPLLHRLRLDFPFQPYLVGDTLWYYAMGEEYLSSVDIHTLEKLHLVFRFPDTQPSFIPSWWYLIGFIILFIALIFGFRKSLRSTKQNVQQEEDVLVTLIEKLKARDRDQLTKEELDCIFDIQDKTEDSAKVYRSKYCKEINSQHPNAITRTKSKEDGRSFIYKINF